MTDLTEIFARNVLTPNSEGQVGFTKAELAQIIAYYKDLIERRGHFRKDGTPKKTRTRKGDPRQLEDLITDEQPRHVVRKIAP